MIKISFGLLCLQPLWLYPVLGLSLGGTGLTTCGLMKLTKLLGNTIALTIQVKTLLIVVSIVSLIALGLLSTVAWSLTHEQPPQFFPFDDPEATYTITKHGDNYMLKYSSTGDMNAHQVCDRKEGKTECRTEIDRDIETMIGNSDVPLEPLLGQPVRVNGEFTYSNKQCVADECHDIGGWAVLNIESIEAVLNH